MAKRNYMILKKSHRRFIMKVVKRLMLSVAVFGGLWISYILTPPTNLERLRKLSSERPIEQQAPRELEIEQISE